MSKKIVELSTKRKVELKMMSVDDVDTCNDIISITTDESNNTVLRGLNKSRTAWLRRGILGGDFNSKPITKNGFLSDGCIKELSEEERNELNTVIQDYQKLGE